MHFRLFKDKTVEITIRTNTLILNKNSKNKVKNYGLNFPQLKSKCNLLTN